MSAATGCWRLGACFCKVPSEIIMSPSTAISNLLSLPGDTPQEWCDNATDWVLEHAASYESKDQRQNLYLSYQFIVSNRTAKDRLPDPL